MTYERTRLYESANDYFDLHGHAGMTLTPAAAMSVCLAAAEKGLVIVGVEGGIWHAPGFEMRLDCIWDGKNPPLDEAHAHESNLRAARFIESEREIHSAFVLTESPITGYPHKQPAANR